MGEVAYTSKVRIERRTGPLRFAWMPSESQPVKFGVHGAIARHYGLKPGRTEEHAATIDYVVAAAGGWLTGTLGGALEARGIRAGEGRLNADVTGEIEVEDNILVIKRIHVTYGIVALEKDRETIDRVHRIHRGHCPIYRSIHRAIGITTDYRILDEGQPAR